MKHGTIERTNGGRYIADALDGRCVGVYETRDGAKAALEHYAETGELPNYRIKPTVLIGPPPCGQDLTP